MREDAGLAETFSQRTDRQSGQHVYSKVTFNWQLEMYWDRMKSRLSRLKQSDHGQRWGVVQAELEEESGEVR